MDLGKRVHGSDWPSPLGGLFQAYPKGLGHKSHPWVLHACKCLTEPAHPHPGPQRRLGRQRAHLNIKRGNLLLIGGRGQKIAHLGLEWVVHLHINVITGRLLLVVRVHATGSTREGQGEHTAVSVPPTWAKPPYTRGARNQTCCFSLASAAKGKLLLEKHSYPCFLFT